MTALYRHAAIILLLVLSLSSTAWAGQAVLGDVVSGGSAELLGLSVSWDSVRVGGVVPYGVAAPGDMEMINVTVGAALFIDFDYDPETGYDYSVGSGYVLKGVDAVLAMRVSYNWSETTGPAVSHNYSLAYDSLLSWPPKTVNASGVVSGTLTGEGAVFSVDWEGLAGLYEAASGRNASPVYRVYMVAEAPRPGLMNGSAWVVLHGVDTAECGASTVSSASIAFTGSPSDWPAEARICVDPRSPGVPGFLDLLGVYLSNDGGSVYLGLERAGPLSVDYAYKDVFADVDIDNDGDSSPDSGAHLAHFWLAGKERLSLSYRTGPGWRYVDAPIQEALLDASVIEVRADASPAPSGMAPGASIAGTSVRVTQLVLDVLNPGNGSARIVDLLVDTTGRRVVTAAGNYSVKRVTVPVTYGAPATAESGGARLLLPQTAASVEVQIGMMGTPPTGAPLPSPAARAELAGYYYYSVNDTNATGWPHRLYVPYNASGDPLVYYYDKASHAYKPFPSSLVRLHRENSTLELVFTEDLYQRGDPGIIIYSAGPTIGGTLDRTNPAPTAPPLAVAGMLAAMLAAALLARRRCPTRF